MPRLQVTLTRFIDAPSLGVVECQLVDAQGVVYEFRVPAAVVSDEVLTVATALPRPGRIECRVREERRTADGHYRLTVSTAEPGGVASVTGTTEFVVTAAQVALVEDEDLPQLAGLDLSQRPCVFGPVMAAVTLARLGGRSRSGCPYCGSPLEVEALGHPPSAWRHRCACGRCSGSLRGL